MFWNSLKLLLFLLLIITTKSLINLAFIQPQPIVNRNTVLSRYYHNKNVVNNENSNVDVFNLVATKYEKNLDSLYEKSLKIKCPFFRRRAFDSIESLKRILYFLIARHKSIPFFPIPNVKAEDLVKTYELTIDELANIIYKDWMGSSLISNGKGYYITGRISKSIYDEQCYFDGPDPDMPVKGLRKYLLSASQLFDHKYSRADLLQPLVIDYEKRSIKAYWRLEGILNLPWHPTVKPWTGK